MGMLTDQSENDIKDLEDRGYLDRGGGLQVSKQICDNLGGTFKILTHFGYGTEVKLQIPVTLDLNNAQKTSQYLDFLLKHSKDSESTSE